MRWSECFWLDSCLAFFSRPHVSPGSDSGLSCWGGWGRRYTTPGPDCVPPQTLAQKTRRGLWMCLKGEHLLNMYEALGSIPRTLTNKHLNMGAVNRGIVPVNLSHILQKSLQIHGCFRGDTDHRWSGTGRNLFELDIKGRSLQQSSVYCYILGIIACFTELECGHVGAWHDVQNTLLQS